MVNINNNKKNVSARNDISKRALIRKKKKIKKFFVVFFMVFISLVFIFSFVSKIDALEIKEIETNGEIIVSSEKVADIIEGKISGNYLHLFSKRNVLIYPKRKIENILKESFSRISSVDVSISSDRVLRVDITEHRGTYLWCHSDLLSLNAISNECFFVNEDALVFDKAPFFSGPVYFTFFTDNNENFSVESIGNSFIDTNLFNWILGVRNILEEKNIKTEAVLVREDGNSVEMFLDTKGDASFSSKIIIPIQEDASIVLSNLFSALAVSPLKESIEENFKDLLYIDLRFDDQVVYKFE